MPRYKYGCENCSETKIVNHLMEEVIEPYCDKCETIMTKNITNRFTTSMTKDKKNKIGQITKEYIEKNKEVLEQQKKEILKETYE